MSNNQVEYGIRISVDGNQQSSAAVDEVTSSTEKLGTTLDKTGQSFKVVNGQMNDTAVLMRKQAEAADVASEAAKKFLEPLQREIDLFGASRAEAERYRAAKAGLSSAVQQQAAALGASIDAMHRDEQAARQLAAEEDRAAKAADNFLAKLKDQVATLGMNTAQLQAHRAAQLGVSDAAAPLIAKLSEAGAGANSAAKHVEGLNFQTVGARRELLVLAHELSQGNFQKFGGSMLVLGEQTGAAGLLFSATGAAALALGAAVVGVTYAVIKGASEQRAMNNALIETGNYAGVTGAALNEMAHAAVEGGGSLRQAKKAATELAATGKFTGEQIGYITEAAVAMEHATGKSIEKTIKEFESLAVQTSGDTLRSTEAISRAALKLDDQYHFLTESVYEQIRALEKEGNQKDASALATETLAKVTKERAEEMAGSIGSIQRGWNSVKETVNEVVDGLGKIGQKGPAADVARLSAQLADFDRGLRESNERLGRAPDAMGEGLAAARLKIVLQLTDAVDKLNKADAEAIAKGEQARTQSEASHAASRIQQDDIRLGKKGMTELDDAIQKYGEDLAKIAAANPGSALLSQEAVNEHMALLVKAHTAAAKGNDDRAKMLQDALTIEQAGLDRERSIYDEREKMLALYHSKFGLSDDDFYAGRAAARSEYIAAEAIAFAKESALVQASIAKTPQEVAARKAKYDQILRAHQKFVDDMRNAGGIDELDQLGAREAVVKQSNDTINKYLSSLEQEAQKLEDANKGHEQSRAAVERETVARLDLAIAYEKQWLIEQSLNGATKDELDQGQAVLKYLEDERAARLRIAQALDQADADKAAKKAAQKAAQEWDATAKHIEQTLADAIMNGGGNAWKKLKAAIAQQVLQVPLQYIGSIGASLMVPSAAQATSNGSSLIGAVQSASSLYSAGKTMYMGFQSGIMGSLGGYVTTLGNTFGSSAVSAFGAGMAGTGTSGFTTMTASEIYSGMGMTAEAGAASAGASSAAYAIPIAGWIAAGMAMSNALYQQGWDANNGSVNMLGKSVNGGMFIANDLLKGLGLSNSAANILAGMGPISRIFGRKNPEVESQGLQGTVSASGFDGEMYANILEKGGFLRSDKRYPKYAELDTAQDAGFDSTIKNMIIAVKGFGAALGLETGQIDSYSKAIKLELTNDDSKNAELIAKLFGDIGNELSTMLVPAISTFAKTGETAASTLQRLAGDFQTTSQVAQLLGYSAEKVYGSLGLGSAAARERLIDLAGGVSTLGQQAAFYNQNFLTDAQRLAPVSAALDKALASLGLSTIPTTRAAFKALIDDLVNSGEIATEAGAKRYTSLMALAEAFAQVHPAEENTGIAAARSALTQAYQAEADALKQTSDRMSSFAASLRSLRENALLGDLSPLTPQQKYAEAKAQFDQTVAAARAGDTAAQENFQSAYTAFLNMSQVVNASGEQYQRDFAYAQSAAYEAEAWAEAQVDVAKSSLDALQQLVSGQIDTKDAVLSVSEAMHNLAIALGGGSSGGSAVDGSHANGLSYVPFDGYVAELHKGEAVLTANEAISYRSLGRLSMAPLTEEIKALRAERDAVVAELRGMRGDLERLAERQIEGTLAGAEHTADTVATATRDAAKSLQVRETRVKPV